MLAAAVATTAIAVAGWEIVCRQRGYEAALDDDSDLWAAARSRLDGAPRDQIVLIGDSRMLFDMDLDELERGLGGPRAIQLATVATNPLYVLEHLAADEDFRGTVISGFSPRLYFLPPGGGEELPRKGIERYRHWSLAQKASFRIFLPMDRRLAFLNKGELDLRTFIERLQVPQRDGVDTSFVPLIRRIDELDRRSRLLSRLETDTAFRDQVRAIWMSRGPPPPPDPILANAVREGERQRTLWRAWAAVERIRRRGGRVIYVYFPASGPLRKLEERVFPRPHFWDALLAATGAPGIHFQDHRELAGFECPEWSHLTAADSVEFTRR
ncbi:MAG TPA: hypothetical protein VIG06_18805, partial [Kofleriaceae bacterium]